MKKQALLIGINQYQILPELKFARQDAEAVEQALKQNYCFTDDEVMLLTDARPGLFKPTNSLIILSHLEKLANQELDLFIFGFWGHGVVRNGKRYLCPLDVMPSAVEKLGVPFDELMNLLSKIRAKNMCLILDCCQKVHDRGEEETLTAADQTAIENAARDIVLRRKETAPEFQSNVAILNSCKEGQAAYEWDNRKHGIFTAHLLDAMNRRFDSVAQIVGYVSHNVEKTAMELGKTQTPLCRLEGDIPLPVDTKTTPLVTGNVFISYRHCNANLVAPVEEEFKKRGISYFIDRVGVNYGMEYSEALTQALKASKVLLFFWTKDAIGSTDLFREVKMALDLKKTVIPYKIGTFDVTEHNSLYYQLSPLSRYEVPEQTPETVREIVNRVEQQITPTMSLQPSFDLKLKHEEKDPIENFIEQEKQKMQETIKRLQNEALEAYQNEEYEKAHSILVDVLILEPNLSKAKELLSLCQANQAYQKGKVKKAAKEKEATLSVHKRLIPEINVIGYKEETKKFDLPIPGTKAGERVTDVINGVEFAFRWCPAGTFIMGSPLEESGRNSDEKQHEVTLTKGFWMMETEVTQRQWKAVMGTNPSCFYSDELPVDCVSWYDCQKFCCKTELQLPTEAQWEYACRAGSTGAYAGNLYKMAWCGNDNETHPVGTNKPNTWGLCDMHGNVWEWCADWYGDYSNESVIDPMGPLSGSFRVLRGGSAYSDTEECRSAYRGRNMPGIRNYDMGFRCIKCQDN